MDDDAQTIPVLPLQPLPSTNVQGTPIIPDDSGSSVHSASAVSSDGHGSPDLAYGTPVPDYQSPITYTIDWRSDEYSAKLRPDDVAQLWWLNDLLESGRYLFYFLTVVFRSSRGLSPVTSTRYRSGLIFKGKTSRPNPEGYNQLFDSVVIPRLQKLSGCIPKPSRDQLIVDVREYEHGGLRPKRNRVKSMRRIISCPDHIHCVLGIPVGCNHTRLLRDFYKALYVLPPADDPRFDLAEIPPEDWIIASADIEPLLTMQDVADTYSYIRAGKLWRPCNTY